MTSKRQKTTDHGLKSPKWILVLGFGKPRILTPEQATKIPTLSERLESNTKYDTDTTHTMIISPAQFPDDLPAHVKEVMWDFLFHACCSDDANVATESFKLPRLASTEIAKVLQWWNIMTQQKIAPPSKLQRFFENSKEGVLSTMVNTAKMPCSISDPNEQYAFGVEILDDDLVANLSPAEQQRVFRAIHSIFGEYVAITSELNIKDFIPTKPDNVLGRLSKVLHDPKPMFDAYFAGISCLDHGKWESLPSSLVVYGKRLEAILGKHMTTAMNLPPPKTQFAKGDLFLAHVSPFKVLEVLQLDSYELFCHPPYITIQSPNLPCSIHVLPSKTGEESNTLKAQLNTIKEVPCLYSVNAALCRGHGLATLTEYLYRLCGHPDKSTVYQDPSIAFTWKVPEQHVKCLLATPLAMKEKTRHIHVLAENYRSNDDVLTDIPPLILKDEEAFYTGVGGLTFNRQHGEPGHMTSCSQKSLEDLEATVTKYTTEVLAEKKRTVRREFGFLQRLFKHGKILNYLLNYESLSDFMTPKDIFQGYIGVFPTMNGPNVTLQVYFFAEEETDPDDFFAKDLSDDELTYLKHHLKSEIAN